MRIGAKALFRSCAILPAKALIVEELRFHFLLLGDVRVDNQHRFRLVETVSNQRPAALDNHLSTRQLKVRQD